MTYNFAAQKARLNKALNTGDRETVEKVATKIVREWDGQFPDDWSFVNRALWDAGSYLTVDEIDDQRMVF